MDKHLHILLVDDDEDEYISIQDLLSDRSYLSGETERLRFDLDWVSSFERALQAYQEKSYNVYLVDYHLGARDGLELVAALNQAGCKAPIILMTGQGNYEIDIRGMQVGATDYINKGEVNAPLLERTIRYSIERKRTEEALRGTRDELETRVQERTRELVHANWELQAEIAERQRVEAQLGVQTTALTTAANGIFITDCQGNILWCNPAFTHLTGYSSQEAIGQTPRLIQSGKHYREFYRCLWETILSGQVWRGEFINRRKDGSFYIEEQTITPVLDESGSITHYIAIQQDITQRKQAEEEINRQAARAEALLRVASHLNSNLDLDTVLNSVCEEAARALQVPAAVVDLYDEDQRVFAHSAGVGLPAEYKERYHPLSRAEFDDITRKYGHVVAHSNREVLSKSINIEVYQRLGIQSAASASMFYKDQPIGRLKVYTIGEGRQYTQDELSLLTGLADQASLAIANARLYKDLQVTLLKEQAVRKQLIQAEKHSAMSRMVASVAHELNNPIQTIQNCIYLIQQDLPDDSPSNKFLEMTMSETRRVANLVAQLREIYRPSKAEPMQPQEVQKIVEEVHSLLLPHLQHQKVSWELSSEAKKTEVLGIADQLKQVLLNISLNAIEAMQPEGGKLRVRLFNPSPENIAIELRDTGPGILPENLNKVFEPFFTTKDNGTGLGLSICYDIVQRHNGEMMVDSVVGEGAAFIVMLPVIKPAP